MTVGRCDLQIPPSVTENRKMRTIGLLFLLSTLSNVAITQASECQSVSKASERKACLDKAPTGLGG
jgi:hypothetical protein